MTYNPQNHTLSNKGYGTIGKPVDGRTWWSDGITERPFANVAEVLAYFDSETKRKGNFLIQIGNDTYTFKGGTADANLVPFGGSAVDTAPVENGANGISSGYVYDLNQRVNQLAGGGITYANGSIYANGQEVKLGLEYFAGVWSVGTYQKGWLVTSPDRTKLWKASQTHNSTVAPIAGANWELILDAPKVETAPVQNSVNAISSGYLFTLRQQTPRYVNGQLQDPNGNPITINSTLDTQPVNGSTNGVQSGYFFTQEKKYPRYDAATKQWYDWQNNVILEIDATPKSGSPFPIRSGYVYTQQQQTLYYRNGRIEDFQGNPIDLGINANGDVIYYATPKVYASVQQLEAMSSADKVLGASYKVYADGQGYTYEYRKTGEGSPVTVETQIAQVRVSTQTYENGTLVNLTSVAGDKYALMEGGFNVEGSTYMRAVASGSGYVPASGAVIQSINQVEYANPDQPPVNGTRTVYEFVNSTELANFTYTPGVYEFIDITSPPATDVIEVGNPAAASSNGVALELQTVVRDEDIAESTAEDQNGKLTELGLVKALIDELGFLKSYNPEGFNVSGIDNSVLKSTSIGGVGNIAQFMQPLQRGGYSDLQLKESQLWTPLYDVEQAREFSHVVILSTNTASLTNGNNLVSRIYLLADVDRNESIFVQEVAERDSGFNAVTSTTLELRKGQGLFLDGQPYTSGGSEVPDNVLTQDDVATSTNVAQDTGIYTGALVKAYAESVLQGYLSLNPADGTTVQMGETFLMLGPGDLTNGFYRIPNEMGMQTGWNGNYFGRIFSSYNPATDTQTLGVESSNSGFHVIDTGSSSSKARMYASGKELSIGDLGFNFSVTIPDGQGGETTTTKRVLTEDDLGGTGGTSYTDEQAQDAVAAAIIAGTPGATYNDVNNSITIPAGSGTTTVNAPDKVVFPPYATSAKVPYTQKVTVNSIVTGPRIASLTGVIQVNGVDKTIRTGTASAIATSLTSDIAALTTAEAAYYNIKFVITYQSGANDSSLIVNTTPV